MKNSGFGKYGWLLIVIGFLTMYCNTIMTTGINTIAPKLAEQIGQGADVLLSKTSLCGIFTALSCVVLGLIHNKFNCTRIIYMGGLMVMGIAILLVAFASKPWHFVAFFFAMPLGMSSSMGYGLSLIINNWFPRKKGLILGIVTVGVNVGSMTVNWLITALWNSIGVIGGFAVLSAFAFVPFILMFFIKDYPEMQGCFPDNEPVSSTYSLEELKKREHIITQTSPFTFRAIFTNMSFWFVTISCGVMIMVGIGIDSSLLAAALSFGDSWSFGMWLITIPALIGIPSSVIFGAIDTKFGTRLASILVCIFGIIALLIMYFHAHLWSVIIFIICYGAFNGAANNMYASLMISKFGKYDSARAFAFSFPIFTMIQRTGTWMSAVIPNIFGNYESTFFVFSACLLAALVLLLLLGDNCVGRSNVEVERDIITYKAKF